MTKIELLTIIEAPVDICFDLARSIDLHLDSMAQTGETAIAGTSSGLIGLNESVTWRARHFGVWQSLTSKITEFNYPHSFTDEMVSGAFKSMRHEHHFVQLKNQTLMKDVFIFQAPFGILGGFAEVLFLKKYMQRLFNSRNMHIKQKAELAGY